MDQFTTITVEARDAIEILSLNRPDALNAVTPAMADELIAYFSGLHDRLTTRIVIFRGQWPGILRRRRTRIGCVRGTWRGTSAAAARHATTLLADHPPDAKLPAADGGAGSRCRMRRG